MSAPDVAPDVASGSIALARALEAVEASGRAGWRSDMFSRLLTGGRIAKFIDWHKKSGDRT